MNKIIYNSKTILFLGAGASAFLDKPLMKPFVEGLMKRKDIRNNDNYHNIINTLIGIKGSDLEILLSEIDGISQRTYFGDTKNENDLIRFLKTSSFSDLLRKTDTTDTSSTSEFAQKYRRLIHLCDDIKWIIYDEIFKVYYDIDKIRVKSLFDPIINLIESATSKDSIIPIFTTNYDKAVEEYCGLDELDEKIELMDGFKQNNKTKIAKWSTNAINGFTPQKNKLNICLFKLHGSIFWYRREFEIMYSPVSTLYPSQSNIEPVILFPNYTKNIKYDPFLTNYSYFQRCLDTTHNAIFIGYSFRDPITVTMLKNALQYNPILRVCILDPVANEICENIFRYYKNRFYPIDCIFTDEHDLYLEQIKKMLHTKRFIIKNDSL
jgi:hypothetical protein